MNTDYNVHVELGSSQCLTNDTFELIQGTDKLDEFIKPVATDTVAIPHTIPHFQ